MERLTNVGTNGEIWISDNDETRRIGTKAAAYKRLKSYEDAEEQGLLWRLPCKVGATVWILGIAGVKENKIVYDIFEATVIKLSLDILGHLLITTMLKEEPKTQSEFVSEYIGDVVFLTKPAAETRLKEIEKEQIG